MGYVLKNLKLSDSKEITADISVPPDSHWFSGHFPDEPILPGIAQLGIVFDAINQSGDQNFIVSSISRVRFKQIIRPNDHLRLIVTPKKNSDESYDFRIKVEEELVCSGVMTVTNRTNIKGEN